jgi:hypothetical protein
LTADSKSAAAKTPAGSASSEFVDMTMLMRPASGFDLAGRDSHVFLPCEHVYKNWGVKLWVLIWASP